MPDDAQTTAFDPAAPASERFDANAELSALYRPLASELLPKDEIADVIDYINNSFAEQAMMKAARGGNILQFPGRMAAVPKRGMRSLHVDNQQVMQSGEYYERPSLLDFNGLRNMVDQTPILSGIIMTRQRQVLRFAAPSEDGGPGFELRHRDKKHQSNETEKENQALLSRFFSNCGWEFNPRRRRNLRRDNFSQFITKFVRDTLTMDSAPIETELKRDRTLGIDGFYSVDGATIRLCTEEGYEGDDEIFAVQVVEGRVTCTYTRDQLIYEPRNPRTDVRVAGYGLGETELLVRVVTGILNAMTYNTKGFDENSIPKGLLHLTGKYSKSDLDSFKRYWSMTVKGVQNAHGLPVMVSEDQESRATFEKFGIDFSEMAFAKWMTFLTAVACAIYSMSPDEINFESFAASKSTLSGSDAAEKLADSKDKGLRPLLGHIESLLSDYIVSDFDENMVFRFAGLDPTDVQQDWEAKKLTLTVNELRAEKGYEAHPMKEIGEAPLNPVLVPIYQAKAMPPPPQPGTDFGGPPAPGEQQDFGDPDAGPSDQIGHNGGPPLETDDDVRGTDTEDRAGGDFGKALPAIYEVR